MTNLDPQLRDTLAIVRFVQRDPGVSVDDVVEHFIDGYSAGLTHDDHAHAAQGLVETIDRAVSHGVLLRRTNLGGSFLFPCPPRRVSSFLTNARDLFFVGAIAIGLLFLGHMVPRRDIVVCEEHYDSASINEILET